ncbi:DUF1707 SHOCT-like domain-containing protein [Pseudonocardia sediminis]|uniref:DUF1707 SHOCT-like domain-containing protein n=1 Tax=Pseudonocardia sediminis TaxID=1397368 RepID=UPI0013EF5540|nr:DUF1707 domain-containing protein [Pseudonocardia sediminis]
MPHDGGGCGGGGRVRTGTAERESAARALNEHLDKGRLGVEEYADRSARAANAGVVHELTDLFTDLLARHPVLPGAAPLPVAGTAAGVDRARPSALDTGGPTAAAGTGGRDDRHADRDERRALREEHRDRRDDTR